MKSELLNIRPLVLDGAMGTMLQARGLPAGAAPDLWNMERPEAVREIHGAYIQAGARMLLANTFGCNAARQKNGPHAVEALVTAGIACAREAAGESALVALDLGPLGVFLEPFGDLEPEEAEALFAEPIRAGADADCIVIETMMDLSEAEAALNAARRYGGGKPVACCFSFQPNGRLLTGADAAEAFRRMEEAGADAVGCNCGLGPEQLLELLPALRAATSLPLIMKPNAGLPTVRDGATVYDMPPARFAEAMLRLFDAGVWALGGCCGTSPAHIEALAAALRARA
ncbi:MAG: homocysteine S-methyltransferase family protein [Clostridia bacterium]|nr:homocysteine S-methyltransferase family protein [Clostridia bacterium]